MRKIMTIIFSIAILLFVVACSTTSKEDLKETATEPSAETPPDLSIRIDHNTYSTLLGSYCWEQVNEQANERTVECVDKEVSEVLLANKTPILVQANTLGKLNIDHPIPPTDIDLSAFQTGDAIDVNLSDQTFSFPSEQGIYHFLIWLTWEEDDELINEASYIFVVKVE